MELVDGAAMGGWEDQPHEVQLPLLVGSAFPEAAAWSLLFTRILKNL